MKVAVIGGGPAGCMAASEAARSGHDVTLFEKNEKLGKKLYITGKGRCNVTNSADRDAFFDAIVHNSRFLYSAFAAFNNKDIQSLFINLGVPLKTERGGRVFPESDKSNDILRALERYTKDAGVKIKLNTQVDDVIAENGSISGVAIRENRIPFDAVVIATGGLSYPSTGSTGDGYRFAQNAGHTVTECHPSLIALTTEESWPYRLSGLTLKNVCLTAKRGKKTLYSEQGEMLLTHFGISGPLVLTLSSLIAGAPEGVRVFIDLKPALSEDVLEKRLLRDISENTKKTLFGALHALLPERLLETVFRISGIDGDANAGSFDKKSRRRLIETLKALPLTVSGTRPMQEAIVTRGGVTVSEVNSSTMESKKIRGLYFAGEVLDVDAVTGGYNLQIAWSTGVLAGRSIHE